MQAIKTIIIALLCALGPNLPVWAQSSDFSRPTALTNLPLVGEFDGGQNQSRYYTFEAGPGSFLVTFDGHTSKYSTSAQANLWDVNRNALGEIYLVAKDSPSSETKKITLAKRQRVVLETVMKADKDMGVLNYSVNLSGAIHLPPTAGTISNTATSASFAASSSAPGGGGKLRLEMRDGSVKDFDMRTIRRIIVE